MSYATPALPTINSVGLALPSIRQSARVTRECLMWLGGGLIFATTIYVMAALPGLLE